MSYEVLESRKTYEGKIVTITVDKLRMPDGSEAYRETVIRKKNAAGVLAVDTDGRLLFVRQYRHPFREMLLEIPAGVIEEGESGEAAVLRELEEETGLRAGKMEKLTHVVTTPGFCTEQIGLYLATELSQHEDHPDPDEFLHVEKMPLSEAVSRVMSGELCDAKTALGLLMAWQKLHA